MSYAPALACLLLALAQETPAEHSVEPREVPVAGGPQGELPPAPPRGRARTYSGAVSAGPGWLALRDDRGRDGQTATSLAGRLGVVIGPEWNLVLGIDHARTGRGGATFSQTAGLIGAQRFLFGRVYLGGGLGMAFARESGIPDGLTEGPAATLSAHLGVEAVRLRHAAFTAEVSFTLAEYDNDDIWEMAGLRLGVVLF
jgi:hypothetical protein